MSIWKIDSVGRTVGIWVSECLQINRVDPKLRQPSDKMIDIATLLLGVGVV